MTRTIVVDLDGTLIRSDLLVESIFLFLRKHPVRFLNIFVWLFKGKAHFKRRIADAVLPDVHTLPYNEPLLAWLKARKAEGAVLVLATASDLRLAQRVAAHVAIFDEVLGTEDRNLAARHKRDALIGRFGQGAFEYVGNSGADVAVWEAATLTHVANPDRGVLVRARRLGRMGELFDDRAGYLGVLRRALRMHQWAKNLLVFVPLLAVHRLTELPLLLDATLAFLCFGACASSVYLLNDLLDLEDDRQHRTKRFRPLAAGAYPIAHAMLLMPALLLVAFGVALLCLPLAFSVVLLGYYALTLAYSLWLKRMVMVDVVALAMLYTVRVVAGTAAISVPTTFWILAFCMFIFLSLAFVKRYTELHEAKVKGNTDQATPGRGYMANDFELLASLGGAAGYVAVLVLALYINDSAAQVLYAHPERMWVTCPLLLFWLSRVWLLAHRGQMNDDPIVFALRDRVSRWVGVAFALAFMLAAH
ncbi:UbiA family prenyltransferase [Variovorax sp. J31P207]|uniref:UbiA family prenyltransferase n=1 Tax=Variovorax sp. J31P207 TaxID=3053510 RepID=UPI002578D663|nr:UbiA family prenyltransferase [Variovorax sp. J31P207]MDM0067666.1 UbiA family prenyltransferase [Variovorax sp. J31P207]